MKALKIIAALTASSPFMALSSALWTVTHP